MSRIFLLLLFVIQGLLLQAQMSDFISLKRQNNRHVGSYFKGSRIHFQRVNGQQVEGYIEAVRNDSVFVRQWQVMTFMTQLGTTRVDTVGYFIHGLHYQEIFRIFPERRESWRFVKNGAIFMIGGLGYMVLNVVNGIYREEPLDDPENLRSLAIASGVAAGGFLLNRIYRHRIRNGKLYKIVYVKMTGQ